MKKQPLTYGHMGVGPDGYPDRFDMSNQVQVTVVANFEERNVSR